MACEKKTGCSNGKECKGNCGKNCKTNSTQKPKNTQENKEETLNNLVNKYIIDCANKLLDIDSGFEKHEEDNDKESDDDLLDKEETLNNLVDKYIIDCANKLLDIDSGFKKQLKEHNISNEEARKVLKKELSNFVDKFYEEVDEDDDEEDEDDDEEDDIVSNMINNMKRYRYDVFEAIDDLRNRLMDILFVEMEKKFEDAIDDNTDVNPHLLLYCYNKCLDINKMFEISLVKIKELGYKTITANDEIANK